MFSCPFCKQNTIGPIRRFSATPAFPAKCSGCGARVHPSGLEAVAAALAPFVTLLAAVVVAIYLRSYWGLLLWPIALLGVVGLLGTFGRLEITNEASIRSERNQALAVAVVALLLILAILFL